MSDSQRVWFVPCEDSESCATWHNKFYTLTEANSWILDHRHEPGLTTGCPFDARERFDNARFWIWENSGWVKITLKPMQKLEYCNGGPGEEGWSYAETTLVHQGDHVARYWSSETKDCDGRMSGGGEDRCELSRLKAVEAGYPEGCGIYRPEWKQESELRFDHSAEAAGY